MTSNFGFSNLYEIYSNVDFSDPSSIGKILLKTLSIPFDNSLNWSSRVFDFKNSLYEFFELQ